jgi:hypothetical protein
MSASARLRVNSAAEPGLALARMIISSERTKTASPTNDGYPRSMSRSTTSRRPHSLRTRRIRVGAPRSCPDDARTGHIAPATMYVPDRSPRTAHTSERRARFQRPLCAPSRPCRVPHGHHPSALPRRRASRPIGCPNAALVQQDQARERRKALIEPCEDGGIQEKTALIVYGTNTRSTDPSPTTW